MTRFIVMIGVNVDGQRDDADNPGVRLLTVDAETEEDACEIVERIVGNQDQVVTRPLVYEMDRFQTLVQEWASDRADYVQGDR